VEGEDVRFSFWLCAPQVYGISFTASSAIGVHRALMIVFYNRFYHEPRMPGSYHKSELEARQYFITYHLRI